MLHKLSLIHIYWFEVSWKRGDKSYTAKVRVAMNGPKKLRIEEMK